MPRSAATAALAETVEGLALVDHHVHGAWSASPTRDAFGNALNEGDTDPLPDDVDPFDGQLGVAVRAWCAPVLELPRHVAVETYWERRHALGEDEVNRRFLRSAGVSDWFLDTGLGATALLDVPSMAERSQGGAHEITRLETVAETVAASAPTAGDFPDEFRRALAMATAQSLGAKSILAYRCGFDVDLGRPTDAAVALAYGRWMSRPEQAQAAPRLDDPTVIAFAIHEAIELGLPVQLHVGFGDRDLDLLRVNPLLLTDFLRLPEVRRASVLLLHCYPYEREAGYLTQAFANVYADVGLTMNHSGARSAASLARLLEVAPFHKVLYSSDAYGPAELHYLGARLWRNALVRVLGGFVAADEWSAADAARVARMTSRDNAFRAYPRAAERLRGAEG